jgi:hypothetical protein
MSIDELDPLLTGAVEQLFERHGVLVLYRLAHQWCASAGEVHLGEAKVLRPLRHHHAERALQEALLAVLAVGCAYGRHGLLFTQDVQAPERAEDGDVVAHGGRAVGDDEGGHDPVEVTAEQDDRLLGGVHSQPPG